MTATDFDWSKVKKRPLWERSPESYLTGQAVAILLRIEKWPLEEPLTLAKFMAEYIKSLPDELPQALVKKLIAQAIDVFEANVNAEPVFSELENA